MSAIPRSSAHSLRIIALPLARPTLSGSRPRSLQGTSSPSGSVLTYYQFQVKLPPEADGKPKPVGYMKRVQTKAADMWAGFGKAKEGSWKLKTYQYGERLVDRMDFEELALKGVDPSLGPSITHLKASALKGKQDTKTTVSLTYPPSLLSPPSTAATYVYSPLENLRTLLARRKPRHRKGFYTWMIIAPFTAPFMIIPIIPNLPFFFCVWRSWSHWRAYRASQYLESLLESGFIVPEANEELDKIYEDYGPLHIPLSSDPPTSQPISASMKPTPEARPHPGTMENLLTRDAVPVILSLFSLPSSAGADIYRAIEQARLRIARGTA